MEHTLALIGRAHQGDKVARDRVYEENKGLVYSVIKRFQGRGVEAEDLFQIGSIGLLKAVDRFDPSYEVKFSTYAVPVIIGEIKRYFRDTGTIKVSRSLKEAQYRVFRIREELEMKLGREPAMSELSRETRMTPEELNVVLEAGGETESLYKTIYSGEGTEIFLLDRIPEKENRQEKLLDRVLLEELIGKLENEERKLIYMRYFQDMTQKEIAEKLHTSQVQVSRMEKRILLKMRKFCRI